MAGQLARGVRLLASQVFHLVEEVFQLAGVGIPAVVRIAVGGFGGQSGEDVIEFGAQVGGRVGAGADPGEHRGDRVRAGRIGAGQAQRASRPNGLTRTLTSIPSTIASICGPTAENPATLPASVAACAKTASSTAVRSDSSVTSICAIRRHPGVSS